MTCKSKSGIVNETFQKKQEIGFSLRNNGTDSAAVRFFAQNTTIPFTSGLILAENGDVGASPAPNNPFGILIANDSIIYPTLLNNVAYEVNNLGAGATTLTGGSPFGVGQPFFLEAKNEVWIPQFSPGGTSYQKFDVSSYPPVDAGSFMFPLLFPNEGRNNFEDASSGEFWMSEGSNVITIDTTTNAVNDSILVSGLGTVNFIEKVYYKGKTKVFVYGTEFFSIVDFVTKTVDKTINHAVDFPVDGFYNELDGFVYYFASTPSLQLKKFNPENGAFDGVVLTPTYGNTSTDSIYPSFYYDKSRNKLWYVSSNGYEAIFLNNFTTSAIETFNNPPTTSLWVDETKKSLVGTSNINPVVGMVNYDNDSTSVHFNGQTNDFIVYGGSSRSLYGVDSNGNVQQVLIFSQIEVLGSTARSPEQIFMEIASNPIECSNIQVDAGTNRKQATVPLVYINSRATGKQTSKPQPLIWDIMATDNLTIMKLDSKQLTENGLRLSGERGVLFDIEPLTEIYINFVYGKQAQTSKAIFIK